MTRPNDHESAVPLNRAQRIRQVIDEYLERRGRGAKPSDLIEANPDLMPELREELRKCELIGAARRKAEQPPDSGNEASADTDTAELPTPSDLQSGRPQHGLHVRCPHCRKRIEIEPDSSLSGIVCTECGGQVSLISDEKAGHTAAEPETIGHFQLIKLLGVGSFGAVWEAKDASLDRTVAIKIRRHDKVSSVDDERFLHEARAAAQLNHQNIVSVHEVGRDGDTVYIVSDLVDGATLSDRLSTHPPTTAEAAKLCVTIAEALHHAHQAGVIHRDLKPGNIMIDRDGEPHIMDFGLAKREAGEVSVTLDGQIVGTPAYMSPEQARGDALAVDCRTDIYSLGVILFQLLTGELPFRGSARMLILQILGDEPPRPRRLHSRVPDDLETITLKCMERDPDGRYQNAADVAAELQRFLRGEPIHSRPIRGVTRAWRWCKRKPLIAGLSGALIVSLLCIAIVGPLVAVRQTYLRRELESTLCDTYTSLGLAAGERGDPAQAVLWFACAAAKAGNDRDRALANQVRVRTWSRETAIPIQALPHPSQHLKEITFHPGGRYLMAQSFDESCTVWDLLAHPATPIDLSSVLTSSSAWSSDGRRLALGTWEGDVRVVEFPSGEPIDELIRPGPVTTLQFSRDEKYLAIAGYVVRIWDCQSHQFLGDELHHPTTVHDVNFSDSCDRLVTTCKAGTVRVFAISAGRIDAEPLFEVIECAPHMRPLLLNDDALLVTLNQLGDVELRDASDGQLLATQRVSLLGSHDVRMIRAGPQGNHLVVCRFPEAQVFSVLRSRGQPVLQPLGAAGHLNRVLDAAFSPDARFLLTAGIDRVAKLTPVESLQQSRPAVPSGRGTLHSLSRTIAHQDEVILATFAPGGECFATAQADGLVRIWSIGSSNHSSVPIPAKDSYVELSWDGRHMAPSGWRAERELRDVQVFEVATGEPVGPRLRHDGLVNAVLFLPDGRGLVTLSSLSTNVGQRAWPEAKLVGEPGWIRFWELGSPAERCAPIQTPSEPVGGSCRPDGKLLVVVCAGGEILLIDPSKGRVVAQCRHPGSAEVGRLPSRWVQFAPDGRAFATWGLGPTVCVWGSESKTLRYELQQHSALCRSAAFSRDGQRILTTSDDRSVIVWDTRDGRPAAESLRHPDWVFSACFSRDGRHVLTGCRDHMARLWDWRKGTLVCPPFEHEDEVFCVRFSPDGRWVLTSGRDQTLRVWESRSGRAVTPPWRLSGYGHQLRITPDGRYAVAAGAMPALHVFDLRDLLEAGEIRGQPDPDSLRLLGEILSGREILGGGGTVNLTSAGWLQRWQDFQEAKAGISWKMLGAEDFGE